MEPELPLLNFRTKTYFLVYKLQFCALNMSALKYNSTIHF